MANDPIDVWIVDDDQRWRRQLCGGLARTGRFGAAVGFAGSDDARRALDERAAPRVLLIEHAGDTVAACRLVAHLRTIAPATGAIAVSHLQGDGALAIMRSGAVGYVAKPTAVGRVAAAIDTIVRGGAPIDPLVARAILRHLHGDASPAKPRLALTERERVVVRRLVDGGTLKAIAAALGLSPHTVDTHLRNIYTKLGVHSKSAAVARLLRDGLV